MVTYSCSRRAWPLTPWSTKRASSDKLDLPAGAGTNFSHCWRVLSGMGVFKDSELRVNQLSKDMIEFVLKVIPLPGSLGQPFRRRPAYWCTKVNRPKTT